MPSPVCVPCQRAMKMVRIGVVVEFTRRGKDSQLPYQKFSGDQYRCPNCGVIIITSYGKEPVHHQDPAYGPFKADVIVPEIPDA